MKGQVSPRGLMSTANDAGRKVVAGTSTARQQVADSADEARTRLMRSARQAKSRLASEHREARGPRDGRRQPFDLAALPGAEKLVYCRVLASMARVDGVLDSREIASLYLFASTIDLDDDSRTELRRDVSEGRLLAASGSVGGESAISLAQHLRDQLGEDDRGPLFALLVRDLVRVSRADRHHADVEREQVVRVAALVFSQSADKVVRATEQLVIAEEDFATGKITTSQFEAATKGAVAKVLAFGAPIGAVSLAGSVPGLGAAGITSGLAALGFGGLLGLSAMVTGIGTVVILGVGIHQGARYLLAVNERERAKRREHLIQQVLANHQQAMADLSEDIAGLGQRMDTYLSQSSRNEEELAALRAEFSAFQRALADLQTSRAAFERGEPLGAS